MKLLSVWNTLSSLAYRWAGYTAELPYNLQYWVYVIDTTAKLSNKVFCVSYETDCSLVSVKNAIISTAFSILLLYALNVILHGKYCCLIFKRNYVLLNMTCIF